jgi:hypothetical protein
MSEEHASYDSRAKEIIAYSYLHALAADGTLHDRDAEFMKHLVLKDGVIDDEEAVAIHHILRHIEGRPVVAPAQKADRDVPETLSGKELPSGLRRTKRRVGDQEARSFSDRSNNSMGPVGHVRHIRRFADSPSCRFESLALRLLRNPIGRALRYSAVFHLR